MSTIRSLDAVSTRRPPQMPVTVAKAFSAFPERVRAQLLQARDLIFETAAAIEGVGPLTEALKWGEPAYLTEATGSGSTIRLGWFRPSERDCAVLFNCRTTLVDDFRSQFPDVFAYEKNRAILLDARKPLPKAPLSACLGMALTYHRRR
jgi:Domain of unknown function (DU1801)